MHSFSIDTEERRNVILWLALFSLGVSSLIPEFFSLIGFTLPSFLNKPSVLAIFGLVYKFFDSYAWKWSIFRKINLVLTPNLNGIWEGEYSSSYKCEENGSRQKGNTVLRIEQSWTKIRMISENEQSISCSEVAGVSINDNMGIVLRYQYKNEPKFTTVETMHCHTGFHKLRYLPDKQIFEGDYFTDKNRQTYGTLFYKKIMAEK